MHLVLHSLACSLLQLLLNGSMQVMITASPDDQTEVSLTTTLQPAAQIGADDSEQSMFVFSLVAVVLSFSWALLDPLRGVMILHVFIANVIFIRNLWSYVRRLLKWKLGVYNNNL